MSSDIFRQQAVDHHNQPPSEDEDVLVLRPPQWTRWGFRLILLLFLATGIVVAFGSVPQYVEGPAVVQSVSSVSGGQASTLGVRALLPPQRRSMLREGQVVRLELADYPRAAVELTVGRIEEEHVYATLPGPTFTAGGHVVRYVDGMRGTVRVTLPSERLLTLLIPALKPALRPTP